jgi:hypothetical protein
MPRKNTREVKKEKRGSLSATEKMSITAGSATALALMPGVAAAGVIHVTGSPVSLPMSAGHLSTATWDVDGANGAEFELFKYGINGYSSIHIASGTYNYGLLNGRGLVGPTFYTDNVQALRETFSVGPNLANGYVWGAYVNGGYRYRNALGRSSNYPGGPDYFLGYDFNYGFDVGDNFVGFRFEDIDGMHYGWAVFNFDTTAGIVTISEWAYESTADTAIHISAARVPEPSTSSLALLGLGAGGLMGWRRRKQERARAAEA